MKRGGKPLKQTKRRLTVAEREQAYAFHESVRNRCCVVCGMEWAQADAHHGIDASYLRRHHLPVYDVRNAVPICPTWEGSCHGDHTSAKKRIPRDALPESVEEFAAEFGLVWWLDRTYGESTERERAA